MQQCLTLKIMGAKNDIESLVAQLESDYEVRATSRLLKNKGSDGWHLFVDLIPGGPTDD